MQPISMRPPYKNCSLGGEGAGEERKLRKEENTTKRIQVTGGDEATKERYDEKMRAGMQAQEEV